MKTIESRLNDLEGKVKPNKNAILVIWDFYDGVAEGYFRNIEERKAYMDWRIIMVKEENKYNPAKVHIYWYGEKDIIEYLPEFRKFYKDG